MVAIHLDPPIPMVPAAPLRSVPDNVFPLPLPAGVGARPGAGRSVPAPEPVERLSEGVYRRRRLAVAAVAAAVVTLALVVGRPDRVPPGEANPWPSVGAASLPAELPGVYVVQSGDTLWDIARAVAPGADPRGVVHEIAEAAGGTALQPGQRLVIEGFVGQRSVAVAGPRADQPAVVPPVEADR